MRDGWIVGNLGDFLYRRTDRLGNEADPGVLTVSEEHGLVDQVAHWGRRIATEDVSKYKVVDPGDVVYNIYLLWAGAIGQSRFSSQMVTSPVYEVFRPVDGAVPEYIGMVLQDPKLVNLFDGISIGTVGRRRRAPWKDFLKVLVQIPPIHEQKRIVDLMDSVDAAISAAQAEVDAAMRLRGDLFGGLLRQLEGESEVLPLGEVGEFIRGRRFTKSDYVDEGLGCIHYGQVHTHFGLTANSSLTFVPREMKGRLRFASTGDVVVAATSEDLDDLGKATVWLGVDDVAVHDDCQIFRHKLDPLFATHLIASKGFHRQKVQYAAGTKVTRISGPNLAKIKVQVPPQQGQEEIGRTMASLDTGVDSAQVSLDRLRDLRSSMLEVLLSGEHEIPETYDQFLDLSEVVQAG